MAFPESIKSLIIPALVTYMEAETAGLEDPGDDGTIQWDYNQTIHSATQAPKGLVFYTDSRIDESSTTGLFYEQLSIRFRLIITKRTTVAARALPSDQESLHALDELLRIELEQALIDAEQYLIHRSVYKLRKGALQVTPSFGQPMTVLAGCEISNAPQRYFTNMNREGSMTGFLVFDLTWRDGGRMARRISAKTGL